MFDACGFGRQLQFLKYIIFYFYIATVPNSKTCLVRLLRRVNQP